MTHDIIPGKICETHRFAAFLLISCSLPPLPSQFLSLNPSFITFIFLCFSSLAYHALILFFMLINRIFNSDPSFPLSVIFFLHPSFFYTCCQISPSTLGKLHFSDYTPIKGPVGILSACCILSLETEK